MNAPSIRILSLHSLQETLLQAQEIGAPDWPGGWIELRAADAIHCAPATAPSASLSERRFINGADAAGMRVFRFPSRHLAWLAHARVSGAFIVVSARNEVLQDSFSADFVLHQGGRFSKRTLKLDVDTRRVEQSFVLERGAASTQHCDHAVLIGQYWHFNYHHWLIECLPRVRDALERPQLRDARLLVPQSLNAFQRDSLTLLGVDPARLLPFTGADIEVRRLWWPSLGCFAPDEIHWLRERCLAAIGHIASSATRRLYVTRADANGRQLVNEAQLWPQLRDKGFERVSLSTLPYAEQIRLFAEAAVVLGPHGAGLTNQIFAPAGMTLCELMPNTTPNLCFYLLANVLNQRYTYAVGESVDTQANFTITPARLAALLDELDLS